MLPFSICCPSTKGVSYRSLNLSPALISKTKSIFVIHAHGDNIDQWRSAISRWPEDHPLILTHQTPLEIEGMYNPGGFTDGDRAVCIALALGAENIEL